MVRTEGLAAGARTDAGGGSVAEALRRDPGLLAWAVAGRGAGAPRPATSAAPAGALGPQLAEARRAAGLPVGPLAVALVEDSPLLGTLGNLCVAAGALGLAREAGLPAAVLLLPARRGARPLYLLDRRGEIRRLALPPGSRPAGGPEARRAALSLLGAAEAVAGRPWPLAHAALASACRAGAPDVMAAWALELWRALLQPLGAGVWHVGLPPLAGALGTLARQARPLEAVLRADALQGAARLTAAALAADVPPEPLLGTERGGILLLVQALCGDWPLVAADRDVALLVAGAGAARRLSARELRLRPRPRWTLLSPAEAAFARGGGAPLEGGAEALRAARDAALLAAGAPELGARLLALGQGLDGLLAEVAAAAATVPGGDAVAARHGARLQRAAARLSADLARRAGERQRALARAWRRMENLVHPFGQDQDEWLAAFPWAAGGARALLARLAAEPPASTPRVLRWPEPPGRPAGAAEPPPAVAAARAPH